jgi:spore coat polysaccharide biosynthesis protein SpsF (cytidylyltransferase family)
MRSATVITARLGSSRMPRKMLAEIGGRTMLERLVERLRQATEPDTMLVATTTESEDDELAAAASALGVPVFRGPTRDILVRWREAAVADALDLLVTCDGDDLFCDPVHVDRIVEVHRRTGAEYITCVGLPFGTAPTGIAREGLERVCDRKQTSDTEGQGRFFATPGIVTRAEVSAPETVRHGTARMTLDYPEDLAFFGAVLRELEPDSCPSLERIVELLRRRPDIVEINAGLQEEYWRRFHARYGAVALRT